MSTQELNAWIILVGTMLNIGSQTVAQIKELFAVRGLTDEQQNAILDEVVDDAKRRRALSAAIAGVA